MKTFYKKSGLKKVEYLKKYLNNHFNPLIFTNLCSQGEVTMCEGCVVVYKANMDIVVYVVGQRWENNELMLMMPLEAIFDSLSENIK